MRTTGRISGTIALATMLLLAGFVLAANRTSAYGERLDMSVTSVWCENPNNGATITTGVGGLSFTVKAYVYLVSTGGPVYSVPVWCLVDGNYAAGWTIGTLQPSIQRLVSFTGVTASAGPHTITVNVNPQHTIFEYLGRPGPGDPYANNARSVSLNLLNSVDDYDADGVTNGNEYTWGTDMLGGFQRWAVLVEGGTVGGNQQDDFDNEARESYNILVGRGYTNDHIWLLTPYAWFDPDLNGVNDCDGTATVANVQSAVQTWLAGHADRDDRVFIYLVDHGDVNIFIVSNGNVQAANMTTWLTSVNCYRMTFVIEACMSGSWADDIGAMNRIFISSAAANQFASPDPGTHWPAFSHTFFPLLDQGQSIDGAEGAFWQAHDHANQVTNPDQDPQMNDQIAGNWFP